ncbi:MAG: diadenylate cyclase CdaA [Eubacterium sp.]
MSAALNYVQNFAEKYLSIPTMYASDVVEIIIIAVIVYYLMLWFRKSKAWFLLKGITVLVLFMVVASLFHLTTLLWIINKTLNVGIIAIVIIFQPELRRALEELGKKNVIFRLLKIGGNMSEEGFSDKSVEELTRATLELAKAKTGALMVIKQEHDLGQYIETGIKLDARITSQLLINIFEKNTPLHDGAVIIEGNEIIAATCYLPLSDSTSLSKDLGTRHRAGLGISEVTDCIVIIVSEESGSISIAREGKLIRYADAAILKNELMKAQAKEEVKTKKRFWKGRGRHEERNDQTKDVIDE